MDDSSQLSRTAKKRLRRKQNRLNRQEEINIPEPVIESTTTTSKYNSKEKRKLLRKIRFSLNSKEENNENIEEKVNNDNLVKEEALNLDNQNTEINEPIINQIENKKIENKTYDEYVTDAVATAREILKKNYCESKSETDVDNTNLDITDENKEEPLMEMVINDDFSTITKNNNLTYTRTIWCLHKDCITSLETFNSKEELEKHMLEVHN